MENKKAVKRTIIIVLAIVISIITTVIAFYDWRQGQVVLGEEYSFEDDYNLYIEYADDYVKTWDRSFLKEENVTISSDINDGFLKVIVEGEFSKIEARYPIKVELEEDKSETIISYNSGTYEKMKNLPSEFDVHCTIILSFLTTTILYYFVIYLIVTIIITIIEYIKEKIYKDMKQKEENND